MRKPDKRQQDYLRFRFPQTRFTNLEARVLADLADDDWIAPADLAARVGHEPDSYFRAILRRLDRRGFAQTERQGVRSSLGDLR